MDDSDYTETDEAREAVALVTAALMINMEEGAETADPMTRVAFEIAFYKDPQYVMQVLAYLASHAAVLTQMVGEATETDPMIIHQGIVESIHASNEENTT
jgi:hypothetical protein